MKYNKDNLTAIFQDKVVNSKSKGFDNMSAKVLGDNLEQVVDTIVRKINKNTYKPSPYVEKLIPKNRFGEPRLIAIPSNKDKLVQCILKENLEKQFKDKINQKLPQEVIHELLQILTNAKCPYDTFVRADIKDFFPRICSDRLLLKLVTSGLSHVDVNLVYRSVENITIPRNCSRSNREKFRYQGGIPQGTSISNILAEIYLKEFDSLMNGMDIKYERYVDDILILCTRDKVKDTKLEMQNYLKSINLELNETKTEVGSIKNSFEFLGYQIEGDVFTIKHGNLQRQINKFARKFTQLERQWIEPELRPYARNLSDESLKKYFVYKLNNIISGVIHDGKKKSFVDFYRLVNNTGDFHNLDRIVKRFFDRSSAFSEVPKNIKKHVRTYYEVKHNKDSRYLFNMDNWLTVQRRREHLHSIRLLSYIGEFEDEVINKIFELVMDSDLESNESFHES